MVVKFDFDCSNNSEKKFDLRDVEKDFLLELFDGEPVSEADEILERGFRALSVLKEFSEFTDCAVFLFKMDDEKSLVIVGNKDDRLIRKFFFSILPEKKGPVVIKKKVAEPSVEM